MLCFRRLMRAHLFRRMSSSFQKPVLTLFTKDHCPLCDELKEALQPYRDRLELCEVDISLPENRVWFLRYREQIPVLHLNGQFLMRHRLDGALLQAQLDRQHTHTHQSQQHIDTQQHTDTHQSQQHTHTHQSQQHTAQQQDQIKQ